MRDDVGDDGEAFFPVGDVVLLLAVPAIESAAGADLGDHGVCHAMFSVTVIGLFDRHDRNQ